MSKLETIPSQFGAGPWILKNWGYFSKFQFSILGLSGSPAAEPTHPWMPFCPLWDPTARELAARNLREVISLGLGGVRQKVYILFPRAYGDLAIALCFVARNVTCANRPSKT